MASSGTLIHSAIEENSETLMARPSPLLWRAISASRMAAWAYMPVPMSVAETPMRPGACVGAADRGEAALGLHQQVVGPSF